MLTGADPKVRLSRKAWRAVAGEQPPGCNPEEDGGRRILAEEFQLERKLERQPAGGDGAGRRGVGQTQVTESRAGALWKEKQELEFWLCEWENILLVTSTCILGKQPIFP